jgi:hypothetical protein
MPRIPLCTYCDASQHDADLVRIADTALWACADDVACSCRLRQAGREGRQGFADTDSAILAALTKLDLIARKRR